MTNQKGHGAPSLLFVFKSLKKQAALQHILYNIFSLSQLFQVSITILIILISLMSQAEKKRLTRSWLRHLWSIFCSPNILNGSENQNIVLWTLAPAGLSIWKLLGPISRVQSMMVYFYLSVQLLYDHFGMACDGFIVH